MPALNPHLALMPSGYLFREVSQRIVEYKRAHPADDVIRLGIGDVTRPLPQVVTRAMADAAMEMIFCCAPSAKTSMSPGAFLWEWTRFSSPTAPKRILPLCRSYWLPRHGWR